MEVSNVHTGIGSDGMILIQPSDTADLGMRIFNKDGSEGMNCGNGLRCTAKYAYEQGIIDSECFRIETKARIVEVSLTVVEGIVQEVTINMGAPLLNRFVVPMLVEDNNHVISEPNIGTTNRFNKGAPILMVTSCTIPSTTVSDTSTILAFVSIRKHSLSMIPCSYAYFAVQRSPFPQFIPSDPSLLKRHIPQCDVLHF